MTEYVDLALSDIVILMRPKSLRSDTMIDLSTVMLSVEYVFEQFFQHLIRFYLS